MSESPAPRSRALLWTLLILPAAVLGGWLIGQTPAPNPRAAQPPAVRPISAHARPSPLDVVARESAETEELAPARLESREPPRAEVSSWTTLDLAIAESGRNGKPVMLDFNAEWCGPCRRMKQEVFEDAVHGSAVQTAVIPVSIVDRAREDGRNSPEVESLQERFEIRAFPTLVVFSPATGRSVQTRGYGDPDQTLGWITAAANQVR